MLFRAAIDSLNRILVHHAWVGELAGILPLSALIDFIEIPPKLHILQLTGAIPVWSWTVTPAGSRLLLSREEAHAAHDCCQDRFGNTAALEAIDGRYGDRYFVSNPETLRLMLSAYPVTKILNDHVNMNGVGLDLRIQNLEILHIERRDPNVTFTPRTRWPKVFSNTLYGASYTYITFNVLGWILLTCMIIMSAFFRTWISFAFLLLVPVTGLVVFCLYGAQPRRLQVEKPSSYVRLIIMTEHMNSSDWRIVYGESTLVNSLLNRPLEPHGPSLSQDTPTAFRLVLRLCILGQWGLALAAAATKNWDSYFICSWIVFSIISHAFLITPTIAAGNWAKFQANLNVERFSLQLSTRRALLNTIIALNPDTFQFSNGLSAPDMERLDTSSLKCIDPILVQSESRSSWEEATRRAMMEAHSQLMADDLSAPKFREHPNNFLSPAWNSKYADWYWRRFVPEGIYIAAKIKQIANLPERLVVHAGKAH